MKDIKIGVKADLKSAIDKLKNAIKKELPVKKKKINYKELYESLQKDCNAARKKLIDFEEKYNEDKKTISGLQGKLSGQEITIAEISNFKEAQDQKVSNAVILISRITADISQDFRLSKAAYDDLTTLQRELY